MANRRVIAMIPARMAASRFPGKPIAPIMGLPLIEHVRRRALLCKRLDDVYVATCDDIIKQTVTNYGGSAVMTKDTHLRCTDRVREAIDKVDAADIVVILQGDEPLFDADVVNQLIHPLLDDPTLGCSNIVTPLDPSKDLDDPDIVKAVLGIDGDVLYFSRAHVPFQRAAHQQLPVFRQTGLSAFTIDFLKKFSDLPATPLEIIESVDFMRIIEHRYRIKAVEVALRSIGVDRPDDVALVEQVLKNDPVQQRIFNLINQ